MTDRASDPEVQGFITPLFPKRVLLRIQNGKIPKPVTIETAAKGQACSSVD